MAEYNSSEYSVAGIELSSPLINAAGSINGVFSERIIREVDVLAATGIGAITVGSFTIPRQEGNEANNTAYYYDELEGKTYNSMGLPNIGLEAALTLAPTLVNLAHDREKPIIYSCSPTISDGNPIEQSRQLVYKFLQTGVDLVELNVSCPNIIKEDGSREPILGYDIESMAELVDGLAAEVGENQRLGIKLPPYVSNEQKTFIPHIARILKTKKVFNFLVTANTIPLEAAGMSGPATKEVGREQLQLWKDQIDGSIDILSALGVDSGKEIHIRRSLGAAAVEGVTFLWQSDNWAYKVSAMLQEYADLL